MTKNINAVFEEIFRIILTIYFRITHFNEEDA